MINLGIVHSMLQARFFILVMLFMIFLAIPDEVRSELKSSGLEQWSSLVPDGFEEAFNAQFYDVSVKVGHVEIGSGRYFVSEGRLANLEVNEKSLESLINEEYRVWLLRALASDIPETGIDCKNEYIDQLGCTENELLLSTDFDLVTLTSALYLHPDLLIRQRQEPDDNVRYLPDSDSNDVDLLFDYELHYSQYSDSRSLNSGFSFLLGAGENHFNGELNAAMRTEEDVNLTLGNAYWERDYNGLSMQGGLLGNHDKAVGYTPLTRFSPSGQVLGVVLGSSDSTVQSQDDSLISSVPVEVYMARAGRVEVYKEGKLIDTQSLSAGLQSLNTESWPAGVYLVQLHILQNNQLIGTQTASVYKTSAGNSSGWQLSLGFLSSDYQHLKYQTADTTPMIGAHFQQSAWAGAQISVGSYKTSDFQSLELALEQHLVGDLSLNSNLIGATDGTLGLTSRLSIPLFDNRSLSLSYDYIDAPAPSENTSQLANSRNMFTLGTYTSMSRSLYTSFSYSSDSLYGKRSLSFKGGKNWMLSQNTSLDLSASLNKSWYEKGGDAEYQDFEYGQSTSDSEDWVVQIGASLRFDMNSHQISLSSDYESSRDSVASSVNGSTYLDNQPFGISHLSANATTDGQTRSVDVVADLSSPYISGSIGGGLVQSDSYGSNSNSYMNLRGGGALTNWGQVAFTNDTGSQAGLVVSINPEGVGLINAVINGRRIILDKQVNFIPVDSYNKAYITFEEAGSGSTPLYLDSKLYRSVMYPGNVERIDLIATPTVEVFGQLVDGKEKPVQYLTVYNHISKTITDDQGLFSTQISAIQPEIVFDNGSSLCRIDLRDKMDELRVPVIPLGKLECEGWLPKVASNG